MTEDRMGLLELLRKGDEPSAEGSGDFLRQTLTWLLQRLMEAEVSAQIGADRYERTAERTALRNGSRPRPFDTRLGTVDLRSPSCARAATSRPSWSRGGGRSRRWWRWWRRRTSRG